MQQHQPHEGSDRASEHRRSPSTSGATTTTIPPSTKAAQAFISSLRNDSLNLRALPDSPEPPGYNE